ncbi:MAG: SLBB domain-containing protein [Gammaproteobacteria bacterium]
MTISSVLLAALLTVAGSYGAGAAPAAGAPKGSEAADTAALKAPLLQLGPGDSVAILVYGQPDMSDTVYVSDDGTVPVALAGPVQVGGLSPSQAAARIERALRDAKILVDPHVTLTVAQSRSQRVSVLGQVGKPGRYPIESNTSIFDLLAEAGGVTENGSSTVEILRPDKDGNVVRYPISLNDGSEAGKSKPELSLKGGDSVFVPRAPQFYIYGEVTAPGKFNIESGMTVVEAIARAGGITPRGSQRRIEIKRQKADGGYATSKAELGEKVEPGDVIRVKESIF